MITTSSNVRSIEVEAVVIRADGTRQPLGVVASWHRNPLVRFWRWLKRSF